MHDLRGFYTNQKHSWETLRAAVDELSQNRLQLESHEQAGPALGWTSAVAAYGAFIIPKVFGEQIKLATPEVALYGFVVFYLICLVLNW